MRELLEMFKTHPDEVSGRVESIVTDADTAQAIGSGDVPVLGTPRVLALVEAASVSSLTRRIPTHLTSVGSSATIEHLAPTRIGAIVSASAILRKVNRNRLTFDVKIIDKADDTLIASGVIERVVVDREEFLAGLHR